MNNLWVVNHDRGYVGNVDDDYKYFPQRCIYNNITVSIRYLFNYSGYV